MRENDANTLVSGVKRHVNITLISESGLCELVIGSQLPEDAFVSKARNTLLRENDANTLVFGGKRHVHATLISESGLCGLVMGSQLSEVAFVSEPRNGALRENDANTLVSGRETVVSMLSDGTHLTLVKYHSRTSQTSPVYSIFDYTTQELL